MDMTHCDQLVERVNARAASQELVDVKFFLANTEEASVDLVCQELSRLYDALDREEYKEVPSFKDSYR